MTSLDTALRAATAQLRRARARRTVCLLLSDCRVTDDVDPTAAAAGLDELVVVAPASDDEAALAFGRTTGARVGSLERIQDLPDLLDTLLRD
jgi:Mg-chelatase subunit ChlD